MYRGPKQTGVTSSAMEKVLGVGSESSGPSDSSIVQTVVVTEKLKSLTKGQKLSDIEPEAIIRIATEYLQSSEGQADVMKLMRHFAFQGFNARLLYDEWVKRVESMDGAMVIEMVVELLIYYVMRGSKLGGKPGTRTFFEAQARLTKYASTFGLKDTGDPKKLKATDLTLARLAVLFAPIVAKLMVVPNLPRIIVKSTVIPLYLLWPGGASLIPRDQSFNPLYKEWVKWAVEVDKIIRPTKTDGSAISDQERLATVSQYSALQRTSEWISEDMKMSLNQAYGGTVLE